MSPSGKATDFDSVIRRFEPGHPSQQKAPERVLFCWLERSVSRDGGKLRRKPCGGKREAAQFASLALVRTTGSEPGHPKRKKAPERVLFSVIFALRRVLLLRSDIRLTPSGIRFASLGGEYNITEAEGFNITFAQQKYHADEVSISLKTSPLKFFEIL